MHYDYQCHFRFPVIYLYKSVLTQIIFWFWFAYQPTNQKRQPKWVKFHFIFRPASSNTMRWVNICDNAMINCWIKHRIRKIWFMCNRRTWIVHWWVRCRIWPDYSHRTRIKHGIQTFHGNRFPCIRYPNNWIMFWQQNDRARYMITPWRNIKNRPNIVSWPSALNRCTNTWHCIRGKRLIRSQRWIICTTFSTLRICTI